MNIIYPRLQRPRYQRNAHRKQNKNPMIQSTKSKPNHSTYREEKIGGTLEMPNLELENENSHHARPLPELRPLPIATLAGVPRSARSQRRSPTRAPPSPSPPMTSSPSSRPVYTSRSSSPSASPPTPPPSLPPSGRSPP